MIRPRDQAWQSEQNNEQCKGLCRRFELASELYPVQRVDVGAALLRVSFSQILSTVVWVATRSCNFSPILLEMLSNDEKPNQKFDEISIVPVLKGESLDRETIFTYFRYGAGVPDWLLPSVSDHAGEWKRARIFHGGENGGNHCKLFNLKDDIGEQCNLAEQFPKCAKERDSHIEQHLNETQAARPLVNLNCDLSKYDITNNGKAVLKGGANMKPGGE